LVGAREGRSLLTQSGCCREKLFKSVIRPKHLTRTNRLRVLFPNPRLAAHSGNGFGAFQAPFKAAV
jgi:hypothetical protein